MGEIQLEPVAKLDHLAEDAGEDIVALVRDPARQLAHCRPPQRAVKGPVVLHLEAPTVMTSAAWTGLVEAGR